MVKKHTPIAIVADKVQQTEKEDDFDACKLKACQMEQRVYAEKLKTFLSLFLWGKVGRFERTGMQLCRSSQHWGHAITRRPQRYSCSCQQAPSVVHQSHDTSCLLIRSSNPRLEEHKGSRTHTRPARPATRSYPEPENAAASSYPCPAVSSFWYYSTIYAFPSGLFLSDLCTKIFIHVSYTCSAISLSVKCSTRFVLGYQISFIIRQSCANWYVNRRVHTAWRCVHCCLAHKLLGDLQESVLGVMYAYCILSFGRFPGVWILYADVSEQSVCSIFICGVRPSCLHHLWRWKRQIVPKRRHIKFRRRGITQKKE